MVLASDAALRYGIAMPYARALRLGILLTLANLAWAAPATAPADAPTDKVLRIEPARGIADFTLTGTSGDPVAFSSLKGKPTLLFFGFAHCPDFCPATLGQLKVLTGGKQARLKGVQVLMISVDGERDTPAELKAYLEAYSPTFIGMTGPPRRVREIARQFSAMFFKGQADASGEYMVEHTSQLYLLDRKGEVRAAFFNSPVEAITRVTREIAAERA